MRFVNYFTFVFLLSCLSTNLLADKVGRIDSTHDPKFRCSNNELPQERCDQMRARALRHGCVTPAEYSLLVKHNLCPQCDFSRRGLTAYKNYCPKGCFARGTRILVKDLLNEQTRWEAIENVVFHTLRFEVWSIDDSSGIGALSLTSRAIRSSQIGPEEEPMVNLSIDDGSKLGVTSRHAMLLSSGVIVAAEDLKVGDVLAKYNGTDTTIVQIDRFYTEDDVFNLLLDVESPIGHSIIVEGGIVTGDQNWQGGEIESLLGTVILKP